MARDKGLTIRNGREGQVEWSISEQDIPKDPLFQLKPVRFKKKIRGAGNRQAPLQSQGILEI